MLGRRSRIVFVALLVCTAGLFSSVWSAQARADVATGPLPVPFDAGAGLRAMLYPETPPPGANDPSCKVSAAHPNPVILIHGTLFTQASEWQAGAPFLRDNGYCVYTFNYGNPAWISEIPVQGLDDVRKGAGVLAAEVDKVLAETGATKVDLVGKSQGGGILPEYYLNVMGGAGKVARLVGISPSNHGTTFNDLVFARSLLPPIGRALYDFIGAAGPSLTQQAVDSGLVAQVYGQGDTRPGVVYTTLVSKYDEVVTPYDQQFLHGPDVTNILLQDGCPNDRSDHASTSYSERVWRFVLNALDPAHTTPVPCLAVDPYFPNVK